jgi:hypothetical protein
MHITQDELKRRFAYHPPQDDAKREAHEAVRDTCREAANHIIELTGPPCPEQTLAIRKMEEAMFWANAALARPNVGQG